MEEEKENVKEEVDEEEELGKVRGGGRKEE